ncbi:MAG: glutaredoxin [Kofleriaceae bacterium]
MSDSSPIKAAAKAATEKLLFALNRADEIGGEVRDYLQDKVVVDPRYVAARKRLAKLMGTTYVSKAEASTRAVKAEAARAAVAAPTVVPVKPAQRPLGDPELKAQIYGKKSCPWTGRAITLLEKHKVDYDYLNLEEPEYEVLHPRLATETKQSTVPYVYLRGKFIGGFNALSEIERLGQLEVAMMSAEELKAAPAHLRMVEVVARPNTDEVVPADEATPTT